MSKDGDVGERYWVGIGVVIRGPFFCSLKHAFVVKCGVGEGISQLGAVALLHCVIVVEFVDSLM